MLNENRQLNRLFVALDIVVVILSYFVSWFVIIRLRKDVDVGVLDASIYFTALIFIIPIFIILYAFFGMYKPVRTRSSLYELYKILQSNIIAILVINSILFIGNKNPYLYNFSRPMVIAFGIINTVFEFISRNAVKLILRQARKNGFNQKHILLVGYSDATYKFIDRVLRNPGWGYKIHGILDDTHKIDSEYRHIKVLDTIDKLPELLATNSFDEIAITLSLSEYSKLKYIVTTCEKLGVHTKFIPDYGTIIPTTPETDDLDGLPVINIRSVPLQSLLNRFLKRTVDIFGSIVAIILFSPIMIIIAIIIKMTSKGPIIFKQERVGRHNKTFVMYKFRSMVEQTDEEEKTRWTTAYDNRVTKIGKFIRRTSLDETPQFFNVLKGEMSLVGPRPERQLFVEKFKETIPRYMIKHQVRPGITGWAQINGYRGDTPIDKRIQYDLWYIENWTLGLDIKILILTIFTGFINENAY